VTSEETIAQIARLVRFAVEQKTTGSIEIRMNLSQGGISGLSVDVVDKKIQSFRYGSVSEKEKS
jgi:hypothetical protein